VSRRLVILDRDGVINRDSDEFVKSPDEWQPIEGSIEAIARLSAAGFDVVVATNQSGVGRKLIDSVALEAIHRKMQGAVREAGGDISKIARITLTMAAIAGNREPVFLRKYHISLVCLCSAFL